MKKIITIELESDCTCSLIGQLEKIQWDMAQGKTSGEGWQLQVRTTCPHCVVPVTEGLMDVSVDVTGKTFVFCPVCGFTHDVEL